MIHTPNGSILPCGRAVHKINVGYPVSTSLATLHCIRRTTKHEAIFTELSTRRSAVGLRMRATCASFTKILETSVKIILLNEQ